MCVQVQNLLGCQGNIIHTQICKNINVLKGHVVFYKPRMKVKGSAHQQVNKRFKSVPSNFTVSPRGGGERRVLTALQLLEQVLKTAGPVQTGVKDSQKWAGGKRPLAPTNTHRSV